MTVPCFVRRQFNNLVGNVFDVVALDGTEYRFNLKKHGKKTRIFGTGYKEFISDYEMNVGNRVRIDLEFSEGFFGIIPECSMGIEKHRVQVDATSVVYTSGLQLTPAQRGRMDQRVPERGMGMGVVFVHKLTETDINQNGLRIPKEIVKALNIAKRGWVILAMGEYNHWFDASYYTTTDGRLRFKSGWEEFVGKFDLEVGNVVLILFHMGSNGYVKIFFDVM
ncbi:hypothetical protein ACQ4PT_056282 [Festuca glaucescens]